MLKKILVFKNISLKDKYIFVYLFKFNNKNIIVEKTIIFNYVIIIILIIFCL